ncbi:hypothetical protein ACOSQ2_008127 [Xanthoceras sorbifolium]
MHEKGEAAIELFKEMERKTVAPDKFTFVNVLCACAHSGLVEEGCYYFLYMTEVYGIEPRTERYGCMVDLLGRTGMLEEARKLIDEMPMSPNASVLGALVGACKIHRNIELGEQIEKKLIHLEPNNSCRRRDTSSANEMLERIRSAGYVPDTEEVAQYLDEEEKENPMYYHSEKLAKACGLLKTNSGEILPIIKNLCVCIDCHQAGKLISKVYDREIIIRDKNWFHNFEVGECSCKDYW